MAGGLIQLAVYGTQDIFLTGTPQISFFKIVYRRYTNFAVESIKQDFFGTQNFGFDLTCVADKVGDLMYKTYIQIDIPQVALNKNPSLYTLTQTVAKSDFDNINAYYQVLFNYTTANADLARKLGFLTRENNITMASIITTMNNTTGFVPLMTLITNRNALINFITFSNTFANIPELINQKMDLLSRINQIDIQILFNSIITTVASNNIGQPADVIALAQKQAVLQMIIGPFYPGMQSFYLIGYDLLVEKQTIYQSFVNGTYIERYEFAWVEELGHSIIDKLDVKIGNQIIDTHTGDWFIIWNKLTVDHRQRENYDKLIGQVPELITFDSNIKPAYSLIIPLQFWFCRHNGLAIPLVALRYHDVVFELRLKTLSECAYVENDPNLLDMENIQSLYGINLTNVTMYIDYVYLDSDERRRFAQSSHEYLIEVVQMNDFKGVFGSRFDADCSFVHPTKLMLWFAQPNQYRFNPTGRNKCQWTNFAVNPDKTGYSVDTTYIQLNSLERTSDLLGPVFYNYVDNYLHYPTTGPEGLYGYSFALNPTKLQPSSTCNMSRIDQLGLKFNFSADFVSLVQNNPIEGVDTGAYLGVYVMSYNVLRFVSGMAGLAFQVSS